MYCFLLFYYIKKLSLELDCELPLLTQEFLFKFFLQNLCPRLQTQLSLGHWFSVNGLQSLWWLKDPTTGVSYCISCISDIYIEIHNSSKITIIRWKEK